MYARTRAEDRYSAQRRMKRQRAAEARIRQLQQHELEMRVRQLCANVREVTRTWLLQLDARARRR